MLFAWSHWKANLLKIPLFCFSCSRKWLAGWWHQPPRLNIEACPNLSTWVLQDSLAARSVWHRLNAENDCSFRKENQQQRVKIRKGAKLLSLLVCRTSAAAAVLELCLLCLDILRHLFMARSRVTGYIQSKCFSGLDRLNLRCNCCVNLCYTMLHLRILAAQMQIKTVQFLETQLFLGQSQVVLTCQDLAAWSPWHRVSKPKCQRVQTFNDIIIYICHVSHTETYITTHPFNGSKVSSGKQEYTPIIHTSRGTMFRRQQLSPKFWA